MKKGFTIKGFTIIELIFSIFVLSVGVVGIFAAFSVIKILTSGTADRLTATYLAQEGMEIVRNIRDENWLAMDTATSNGDDASALSWVDYLAESSTQHSLSCQAGTVGCKVDFTGFMTNFQWDYLQTVQNGFYGYGTSFPNTKYMRRIFIDELTDEYSSGTNTSRHVIKVRVQVAWDEKATILKSFTTASQGLADCNTADNCVMVEGTLYNWYYNNH